MASNASTRATGLMRALKNGSGSQKGTGPQGGPVRALRSTTSGSVRFRSRLRFAIQPAVVGMWLVPTLRRMRVLAVARFGLRIARVAAGLGISGGRRGLAGLRHDQFPSSNTTSMLTDRTFSPGEIGVDSARSIAFIAIIGIGRGGAKLPPSLMLTMRRT